MMAIACSSRELSKAVGRVKGSTSRTHETVEPTCYVRVVAGDDVRVHGTNRETWVWARVDGAEVMSRGEFLAEAENLMGLRNAGCDLQLSHDGKVLDVKFGRASAKVRLGPEALVWPNAPANETVGFELSAATLVQALEDVADCCDEQSVRMVLGVVQVSIQDGALVASATDSRRLAISRREVDPWLQAKFLVPRKVVRQLASLDFEGDVRVTCGMSRCSIAGNEGGLTWSLPEGRLPKILELVPPGREGNMMVRSEELTRAVRQAAIMVDSRSDGVVLRVGDMLASLVVEGESDLGRAVLSVPLVSGGVADVAVKLSASYLLEALQHVGEEVSLDIASRNDALVVRSGGYVSVIMPRTDVGPQESES